MGKQGNASKYFCATVEILGNCSLALPGKYQNVKYGRATLLELIRCIHIHLVCLYENDVCISQVVVCLLQCKRRIQTPTFPATQNPSLPA